MSGRFAAGAAVLATVAMLAVPARPASAHTAGKTVPADRATALQTALDAVRAADMPGLFAEVRDGNATRRGTSGVSDVSTGAPMQPVFEQRIGSITKTFVATVALQLVGQGRIGLDDPIGRYVGDLVPADLANSVTVRMLLQHTSGIGDYAARLFQSVDDVARYQFRTFSPQQLVAAGVDMPRTNAPGAGWCYSQELGLLFLPQRGVAHPQLYKAASSARSLSPGRRTYSPRRDRRAQARRTAPPTLRVHHGETVVDRTRARMPIGEDLAPHPASAPWTSATTCTTGTRPMSRRPKLATLPFTQPSAEQTPVLH